MVANLVRDNRKEAIKKRNLAEVSPFRDKRERE